MKKIITTVLLLATAFVSIAQTNAPRQLILKPGLNILKIEPFTMPCDVVVSNSGRASAHRPVSVKVYDANDLAQFTAVTNSTDIVPNGASFHPLVSFNTTNKPVNQRTILPQDSNGLIRARHFDNGIFVWCDAVCPTSLWVNDSPVVITNK